MSKMYISTVTGIRRTDNQPFEQNTLFTSTTAAENYARLNKTAYPGQILSNAEGADWKLEKAEVDRLKEISM